MKRTALEMDKVYTYTDGIHSINVLYAGMDLDNYRFLPFDKKRKRVFAEPCLLSEKEVTTYIKG